MCKTKKSYIVVGENDLATTHPHLISEWDHTKNGDLTPFNVSRGMKLYAFWICSEGHSWEALITNRVKGSGCPHCPKPGRLKSHCVKGVNDLATKKPELAKEWHPTKNEDLKPDQVTAGCNRRVWWICPHGHEWYAMINNRTALGSGCPYCTGKRAIPGETDLATKHPELTKEWHPTLNGNLTPSDVTTKAARRVWWRCARGHEWKALISNRSAGHQCPYCSGAKVWTGFNDLATKNPELAKEWHPTFNGKLTPQQVSGGSNKKVFWRCKHGHVWNAVINNRMHGSQCPECRRLRKT